MLSVTISYYQRALSVSRVLADAAPLERMKLLANTGALQFVMHGPAEAEPLCKEAAEIGERSLPGHPVVRQVLLNYAAILQRAKRKAEAGEVRKRAEGILKSRDAGHYVVDVSDLLRRPPKR